MAENGATAGVPVTEAAKGGPIADKVYAAAQKRLKNPK
jgi:hypothetical protein